MRLRRSVGGGVFVCSFLIFSPHFSAIKHERISYGEVLFCCYHRIIKGVVQCGFTLIRIPSGKLVGDCAIRAIAAVEDITWDEAYDGLVYYGKLFKNLPNANDVWGVYLKDLGYKRHVIDDTCPDCYKIKDFCRDHPKGTYVVGTGTHVVAVIDGNYLDAWDSGNETPQYYWESKS